MAKNITCASLSLFKIFVYFDSPSYKKMGEVRNLYSLIHCPDDYSEASFQAPAHSAGTQIIMLFYVVSSGH